MTTAYIALNTVRVYLSCGTLDLGKFEGKVSYKVTLTTTRGSRECKCGSQRISIREGDVEMTSVSVNDDDVLINFAGVDGPGLTLTYDIEITEYLNAEVMSNFFKRLLLFFCKCIPIRLW